jgi:hypothetical protein
MRGERWGGVILGVSFEFSGGEEAEGRGGETWGGRQCGGGSGG